jgi:hypothetical protein
MQIDFHDLLVATSVLVGFQVTLFIWRIDREVEKKPEQHSWLPPSDWLGGLSMFTLEQLANKVRLVLDN